MVDTYGKFGEFFAAVCVCCCPIGPSKAKVWEKGWKRGDNKGFAAFALQYDEQAENSHLVMYKQRRIAARRSLHSTYISWLRKRKSTCPKWVKKKCRSSSLGHLARKALSRTVTWKEKKNIVQHKNHAIAYCEGKHFLCLCSVGDRGRKFLWSTKIF